MSKKNKNQASNCRKKKGKGDQGNKSVLFPCFFFFGKSVVIPTL